MVIFSVVMTLAVSTYRYFFSTIGSGENQTDEVILLTQRKIINTSINSIESYYYLDYNHKARLFFHGNKNNLSFISSSPSYLDEPLVIATLFIINSGRELYYCERALGSVSLINYQFRSNDCPESKLYLQGEDVDLSYFGWKDALELDNYYSEYLNVSIKPKPIWRQQYASAETLTLPIYIKIKHMQKKGFLPREFMFEMAQELPQSKREKNAFSG